MADLNLPNVRVQYLIKEDTKRGPYSSALYFSIEEFQNLSEEELAQKVYVDVQGWHEKLDKMLENTTLLSKEEMQLHKENLQKEILNLQAEVDSLDLQLKDV